MLSAGTLARGCEVLAGPFFVTCLCEVPADDAPTQAALKHGAVYKYFRMTAAHQEVNAGAVIEKLDLSILYVEDELVTRRMVNGILQRRFSTVYQAQDGREGLELFQAYNPDVVITDSKMPAMDGIEMSRIIKSLKPETPIIFTSAYEEPEFMEKLDQIGVQRKFVKPIELKELLKALGKHTQRQRVGNVPVIQFVPSVAGYLPPELTCPALRDKISVITGHLSGMSLLSWYD